MKKNKTIHLLIPMSGQGTRYQAVGYTQPKPMIPVSGKPMIARLMENFPKAWPLVCVMADNHLKTELPQFLKTEFQGCQIDTVPANTSGPIAALEKGLEHIPPEAPVFVSYCDYGVVWDPAQFERFVRQSECDVCLVSYRGFHAHYLSQTQYAYSRTVGERVVEVREKGSFTPNRENEFASTGGYYFKSAALLKKALKYHRELNLKVNNEFYTSLTVQALLQSEPQTHARVFEISDFFQWGTPQDLQSFEYWEKTYANYNRRAGVSTGRVPQLLMPMAGAGSRFKTLGNLSKPLIPVLEQPMYQLALSSLPVAAKNKFVALEADRAKIEERPLAEGEFKYLSETPAGQALSTLEGLKSVDPKQSLFISSCDHSIVYDGEKWNRFLTESKSDAAIFVVRGFPGTLRKPEAYAYVETVGESEFASVKRVSVKKTISAAPNQDLLLIGTFWVKSPASLQDLIIEDINKKNTVNGEYYLDSVFNSMLAKGQSVKVFEIEGYMNWGDPDSLAEALYWYEVFLGKRLLPREKLNFGPGGKV